MAIYRLASIPITTAGGIVLLWLVEKIVDDHGLTGDIAGLRHIPPLQVWYW